VRGHALLAGGSCNHGGERERARGQSSKHQAVLCDVDWDNRKPPAARITFIVTSVTV
jgi:hypothetical protein